MRWSGDGDKIFLEIIFRYAMDGLQLVFTLLLAS